MVECRTCRKEGKKAAYIGETSRSPYQRGKEHQKEVGEMKKAHPLVCHFQEVHGGKVQTLLLRTLVETRTTLERQAWESVMIDRLARNPHQCLNLKNEWCLSRKPALENKGKAKANTSGQTGKEERLESEESKWKRGRQAGDKEGGAGQED